MSAQNSSSGMHAARGVGGGGGGFAGTTACGCCAASSIGAARLALIRERPRVRSAAMRSVMRLVGISPGDGRHGRRVRAAASIA